MTRPLRVLLLGRHFWPHGSIDSAGFLFDLACGLRRGGVHVEVVTPRYSASWPESFEIREIRVHRPAAAPRSDWTMGRYIRHLTTWMRNNAKSFDVLVVDSIREEVTAAVEASRSLGCATVVRVSGWAANSDPTWWRTSRTARKCEVVGKMVDAVIAKNASDQRELIAAGYDPRRIHRIDHGFQPAVSAADVSRRQARLALGMANSDLITQTDTPVVLCASRLTRGGGADLLSRTARLLVARYPDLRFWFIGDGPHRESMFEYLRGEGVRASIAMPGSFCDVGEVFSAADLFVQLDEDGLDYFLPTAISAEVPVVAIDNRSTRAAITGGTAPPSCPATAAEAMVQWISAATSKLTRLAIAQAIDDLSTKKEQARQLRRDLLRSRPRSEAISSYIALMERVSRSRNGADCPTSFEAVT